MSCLSSAQLVRIAVESRPDREESADLESCEHCQSRLESVCLLVRQLRRAYTRLDNQHEEVRGTTPGKLAGSNAAARDPRGGGVFTTPGSEQ